MPPQSLPKVLIFGTDILHSVAILLTVLALVAVFCVASFHYYEIPLLWSKSSKDANTPRNSEIVFVPKITHEQDSLSFSCQFFARTGNLVFNGVCCFVTKGSFCIPPLAGLEVEFPKRRCAVKEAKSRNLVINNFDNELALVYVSGRPASVNHCKLNLPARICIPIFPNSCRISASNGNLWSKLEDQCFLRKSGCSLHGFQGMYRNANSYNPCNEQPNTCESLREKQMTEIAIRMIAGVFFLPLGCILLYRIDDVDRRRVRRLLLYCLSYFLIAAGFGVFFLPAYWQTCKENGEYNQTLQHGGNVSQGAL
jgi:hypothetical protein